MVENPIASAGKVEEWRLILGQKDFLEDKMATHLGKSAG